MRKRWVVAVIGCAMILEACGGSKTPETTKTSAVETEAETDYSNKTDTTTEETTEADDGSFKPVTHEFHYELGIGKVTITGAEGVKGEDGDFLRVYYEYTNTDEKALSHSAGDPDFKLEQDGETLEKYYPQSSEKLDIEENRERYLCPGVTVPSAVEFQYHPDGGSVKAVISLISGSKAYTEDLVESFEVEFDPANLPGAPAEIPEIQPILNPSYTDGWPTQGTSKTDKYTVELTGDYDVEDEAIRIYLNYTNNSDKVQMPGFVAKNQAYQDGISLKDGAFYVHEKVESDKVQEVEPGQTVLISWCFLLESDSPVELVIENQYDDFHAGAVYELEQ